MILPLINPHPTLTGAQLRFRVSQAKLVRFYKQAVRKGKVKKLNPKKRPALRRGFNNPSKESSMVYSLVKKRPRRRAKAKARRRRHNPKFGLHRPTLLYSRGKWFRRKRSKLLRKGTRINPKRSRKSYRKYRRNPALPFDIKNVAMGGVKIAGGIVAGGLLMPVVTMVMPKNITEKYGKYYGAIHVVLGAVLASFLKNKLLKDAALVVAGTGIYDLIASNVGMLGLPQLPRSSTLFPTKGMAGDEPGVIGSSYQEMGVDFAPALGSSYQEVGDDIAYGGDEIEIG